MPPKRQKNLKVSSAGRVEVVEPESIVNEDNQKKEMSVKPKKKTKAKKKVVEVDSGSDEPSDETDFKECESKLILV